MIKMNKIPKERSISMNLYNPKAEGLGTYDIHYMNAIKKNKTLKKHKEEKTILRYA